MRYPWPCRVIKLPKTSYLHPRHARFELVPLVIHCGLMLTHSNEAKLISCAGQRESYLQLNRPSPSSAPSSTLLDLLRQAQ